MQVAVIVVNYCTPELTIECLSALVSTSKLQPDMRVIVVDGGSPDNSVSTISDAIARNGWNNLIELLALGVNRGFSYANNRGIERAIQEFGWPNFFWLLNSDTIARPTALTNLLTFMQTTPRAAIVGSRLEDLDGSPQHSAFRFHSVLSEFESAMRLGLVSRLLKRWRVALPIADRATRVDWVAGASMMVRSDVMKAVGQLDEGFFLYYEESDFCLRVARAGLECWYVPESRVVHLVGQSSGVTNKKDSAKRVPAYWFESRQHYFVSNHGTLYAVIADGAWSLGHLLWRVRRILQQKPDGDPPMLMSDFIGHSVVGRGAKALARTLVSRC